MLNVPLKRWLRRLVLAVAALALCCLTCFLFRAPILRTMANLWIVGEPAARGDAIVILGGGLQYRTFAAARLYQAGAAPTLLITQSKLAPTSEMGLTLPEFKLSWQVLLSNNVPATAIQWLGTNVTSTRDEAVALKQWVCQNHAHSVIIPTDIFHTRRARWIFAKALRGTGAELHIVPVDALQYTRSNWWRHEEGVIAFQNEIVKSLYYWLRY